MNISLYIPCYNVSAYIDECLKSVFQQTIKIDEVLIIDDGSTDNTLEIVSKYNVKVLEHKKNKGLSAARNTALKNAKGDYIASLDADCVPRNDWLENLMKEFQSEDIAGVGGMLEEGFQENTADLWRTLYMPQHWGNERIENPEFLFGSNNVFRRKYLIKTGGYNEKLGNNGEDYDMSSRLKKSGYRLIYTPFAKAVHMRRDTVLSLMRTHWNWYKRFYEPTKLSNILFRVRYNLHCCKERFKRDLKHGNYHLLPVELYFPFDQFGRDIIYYLKN
ncbi:MAG: glycosyltransferase [Candidatus Schekmanbacteria bacterium]|nr:MAG: glycosyltransferase [Candidatus Schekmanbacteria bacterium]